MFIYVMCKCNRNPPPRTFCKQLRWTYIWSIISYHTVFQWKEFHKLFAKRKFHSVTDMKSNMKSSCVFSVNTVYSNSTSKARIYEEESNCWWIKWSGKYSNQVLTLRPHITEDYQFSLFQSIRTQMMVGGV